MSRNFIGFFPVLLVVLLPLQGCEKKESKPAAPASIGTATQAVPTPSPQSQTPAAVPIPAASPATVAPPSVQAPAAKPALATADGANPGSRIEVRELKRVSGGTVMLRFTLVNEADEAFAVDWGMGAGLAADINTVAGVHLIEPVGKKKYLVVRDTNDNCDCSRGVRSIASKSHANLWARFPAPPDNVAKITVVVPKFSPMDDVTISR